MKFLKKYLFNFTSQVIFFLFLVSWLLGFQQSGYEGLFSQLMNGTFTQHQDYPIYGYLSHFLTFRLYLWLGSLFPSIIWSHTIIVGVMIVCIVVFSILVEKMFMQNTWQRTLAALAFVFVFLSDSFFILDLPAYAMLISSLSLLSLFLIDDKKKAHQWMRWISVFTYIFGLLTRIEAALPVTALILLLHLLLFKSPMRTAQKFWPCILTFLVMIVALKLDFAYSGDYYKQLEPWAEPALSRQKSLVALSNMQTDADSMRYIAAVNLIYDDTVQLNKSFIRSLILTTKLNQSFNSQLVEVLSYSYLNIVSAIKNISSTFYLSMFFVLCICVYLSYVSRTLNVLFIYLCCIVAGFFLVATISIDERFIKLVINFSLLAFLVSNFFFLYQRRIVLNASSILYLVILYLVYQSISNVIAVSKSNSRNEKSKLEYLSTLGMKYKSQILVFDLYDIFILPNVSSADTYSNFKKVLFHDAVHEMHINNMRVYFEQQCQCNAYDWSSVYTYFYDHKDDIVFVSTSQRIQLKQDFLQRVYNEPYYFVKEKMDGFENGKDTLNCYRLTKKAL